MSLTGIIIGVVLLGIVAFAIGAYNQGINLKNYANEAFSTMDVYLKKRWDVVPNLVETVKGYAGHEKEIFEKVAQLRSGNYSAMSDDEKMQLNGELTHALSRLFAVAENYPDLKANQNFENLMNQLKALEEDIANSRKYYNGTVRTLNTFAEVFPTNIVCMIFGIQKRKMFEITEAERSNVEVKF